MGADFGMFLNLDNFTGGEKDRIVWESFVENNKTMCRVCYLHTLVDFDPEQGLYRFVKLHQAIRAYFSFLNDEGKLNKSKAIVNQAFLIGLLVSFGLTYITVNWYAHRYAGAQKRKADKKPELSEEEQRRKNLKDLLSESDSDEKQASQLLSDDDDDQDQPPGLNRKPKRPKRKQDAKEYDQRNADLAMYKNVFKSLNNINNN